MASSTSIEEGFWAHNRPVIGTDEAGRGCLCGPVVAAAVCLFPDTLVFGKDSKALSPSQRTKCFHAIMEKARVCVASRSSKEIDRNNILKSSLAAMKEAVERLVIQYDLTNPVVIVDGNRPIPDLQYEQRCIVKGDSKSRTISCASIVAKYQRDQYMETLDAITGNKYNLKKHKGYPTKEHYRLLQLYGPSAYHRQTFRLK